MALPPGIQCKDNGQLNRKWTTYTSAHDKRVSAKNQGLGRASSRSGNEAEEGKRGALATTCFRGCSQSLENTCSLTPDPFAVTQVLVFSAYVNTSCSCCPWPFLLVHNLVRVTVKRVTWTSQLPWACHGHLAACKFRSCKIVLPSLPIWT